MTDTAALDALERAVGLLEMIDGPVARGHDARVTAETWLDVIRPEIRKLRAALRSLVPTEPDAPEGLRADGDGYEVRTWVRHEPSGVVVLPGHPQLGGRYCQMDGGDWPCAAVRSALTRDEGTPR